MRALKINPDLPHMEPAYISGVARWVVGTKLGKVDLARWWCSMGQTYENFSTQETGNYCSAVSASSPQR